MASPAYCELIAKLIEAGAPQQQTRNVRGVTFRLSDPLDIFVNSEVSAFPYEDILVSHAPRLTGNELEMVVRSLTEKGMKKAGKLMISLFLGGESRAEDHVLWAAANALNVLKDNSTYGDVLEICRQRRFGSSRQMLMGLLATIRSDDAYQVLLECLHQPDVRGHAIAALRRFGRTDAIPILEALPVERGKYEHRAKETALKALRLKQKRGGSK